MARKTFATLGDRLFKLRFYLKNNRISQRTNLTASLKRQSFSYGLSEMTKPLQPKCEFWKTAPWKEMMKVTHHMTETSFKDYVTDLDWKDLKPYHLLYKSQRFLPRTEISKYFTNVDHYGAVISMISLISSSSQI